MTFDPEQFKHVEIEGELDTEIIPPDEGVYEAKVASWDIKGGTSDKGNDWARLDVTYELEDPDGEQERKTGRNPIRARQGIFLDLTSDGALDTGPGRNVNLGRLRQACGLNSGKFSFDMLEGQQVKVLVGHRELPDGGTMAEVRRVASIDDNVK